jgi:hypothetical protein
MLPLQPITISLCPRHNQSATHISQLATLFLPLSLGETSSSPTASLHQAASLAHTVQLNKLCITPA